MTCGRSVISVCCLLASHLDDIGALRLVTMFTVSSMVVGNRDHCTTEAFDGLGGLDLIVKAKTNGLVDWTSSATLFGRKCHHWPKLDIADCRRHRTLPLRSPCVCLAHGAIMSISWWCRGLGFAVLNTSSRRQRLRIVSRAKKCLRRATSVRK